MKDSTQTKVEDQALWEQVRLGDVTAYRHLYDTHADMLFNYGRKFTPEEDLIKDSIQEVFLIIWDKKSSINIRSSIKSYLFTVFRRELITKLKQQNSKSSHKWEADVELSIETQIVEDEQKQQIRSNLNRAIGDLTTRQKEILYLRYYENLSYEDISELMSLNHNSMYKLLSAAIKRLRSQLAYMLITLGLSTLV